jgi:putative membrane protein
MRRRDRTAAACGAVVLAAALVSAFRPRDRLIWWLEAAPVLLGGTVLAVTARRFPLTRVTYVCLAAYSVLLLLGAHYAFAYAPPGEWLQDVLSLARNPYDRVIHLCGGLLGAPFLRELLLRKTRLRRGRYLPWIVAGLVLAVGAVYEILEWLAVKVHGDAASEFLATQGDPWDTQWDMLLVLAGAVVSNLLFRRAQDRGLLAMGLSPRL